MIRDDLLVFDQAVGGDPLQPSREPLVQLRADLLGKALVRRISDQQVAEAIGLLPDKGCLVRAHKLHAHESGQPVAHVGSQRLGGKRRHGTAVEGLALHRRALDDRALLDAQPVDARGEQGLDA